MFIKKYCFTGLIASRKICATLFFIFASPMIALAGEWVAGVNCRVDHSELVVYNNFDGIKLYNGWSHSVDIGDIAYFSITKHVYDGDEYRLFVTDEYTSNINDLGNLKFPKISFASAKGIKEQFRLINRENTFEVNVSSSTNNMIIHIGKTVDGLWKGFLTHYSSIEAGVLTQSLTCSKPWGYTGFLELE